MDLFRKSKRQSLQSSRTFSCDSLVQLLLYSKSAAIVAILVTSKLTEFGRHAAALLTLAVLMLATQEIASSEKSDLAFLSAHHGRSPNPLIRLP